MSKWRHLGARYAFHMLDERRYVVGPLRPGIDVAPLTIALAVTSQVKRKGAHAVIGHSFGEPRIAAGVFAEAVHHGECDVRARFRPRPVGELCAFRHRGARTL